MGREIRLVQWKNWSGGSFLPRSISMDGISLLFPCLIQVAQMRPPSLKAIIAWEGWSDGTFRQD
jgi:predicted acyl esterase